MLLVQQILDQEIRGGTTAVVAMMHGGVLYVGNVGDSRALLCKKDRYLGMFEAGLGTVIFILYKNIFCMIMTGSTENKG